MTVQSVTTERHDDIFVMIVNNPSFNALSGHVLQGLSDGIDAALADDRIKAIVLRCDGSTFIAEPSAKLCVLEVTLGLLSGGGG